MEKNPIRLIAFDLDGTVLNREKRITPRTRAALRAAADKGVVLVPATGRPLSNLSIFSQLPGLHLPYALTSNGAAVWEIGADAEAAVQSRWGENNGTPAGELPSDTRLAALKALPIEKALAAERCLYPFLPGNLKAFVNGCSVSEQESYAWEQAHGSAGFRPGPGLTTVVPSLSAYLSEHTHEIEKFCMFFRDDATLAAARVALEAIPGIEIVQGSPDNLEVTAPGVDKGTGLARLCALTGISLSEVLAIGDSENDWGMLRDAGCPAAMANATPETKRRARFISAADNDHDGVAELIETLVL